MTQRTTLAVQRHSISKKAAIFCIAMCLFFAQAAWAEKSVFAFTFDDIQYWVGEGENKAMLIIQLNDGKKPDALAWGYKWNGTKHGIEMLDDIAKADKRLFYLRYYTGPLGVAVGGIGFDLSGNSDVKLNRSGSCTDPEYVMNPCPEFPPTVGDCKSPINGSIVTNEYDFDYWRLCPGVEARWQSGWFETYMSYWVTDDGTDDPVEEKWKYSNWGASTRVLKNNSIDAWYYDYYAFRDMDISTFWVCMMAGDECDGRDFFSSITPVENPSSSSEATQSSSSSTGTTLPSSSSATISPPPRPTPIFTNRENHKIGGIGVQTTNNAILLSNLPSHAKVGIYNLQGKRIYSTDSHSPLATSHLKIDVETRGMYIVKITFGNERQMLRAVVK